MKDAKCTIVPPVSNVSRTASLSPKSVKIPQSVDWKRIYDPFPKWKSEKPVLICSDEYVEICDRLEVDGRKHS